MTQEEKLLLLKDLCARVPYHPKGLVVNARTGAKCEEWLTCATFPMFTNIINNCRLYLRPMSSMTESEKKDILQSLNIHGDIDNEGNLLLGVECDIITLKVCKKYLGELNKRMFDVCHMIEKGLALEAPDGMYNLKEK